MEGDKQPEVVEEEAAASTTDEDPIENEHSVKLAPEKPPPTENGLIIV